MVDGYICNNWSKQLFNGMQLEIAKEECEAKKSIPGGCTGLANGTIYFGYWSILVYRFKFTTK